MGTTVLMPELTEVDIVLYPVIGLWCEMCNTFRQKGEVRGRQLVDGAVCLMCLEPLTYRAVEFACPYDSLGDCVDEDHHYGTGTHVIYLGVD